MTQPRAPAQKACLTLPQPREDALLARARAGDRAAFGELLMHARPHLLRMLVRMLGSRADADDVVQEACICAIKAIRDFRGDARFYSWMYRIARHLALQHLRERRGRHAGDAATADALADVADSGALAQPDAQLESRQLRDIVFDSVRRLPPHLQTAFMLREYNELRYGAVAQLLGCPVGTVRSRIARARAALAGRLRGLAPR